MSQSPHLSNHLQDTSTPMSSLPHNGAQHRQPVNMNFDSPTGSYPSPSLGTPQYNNYPPQNPQQMNEAYRASPTGSNSSMSLPSMRSLDPMQQQQGHLMGSPLPPPGSNQMNQGYYQNPGHTLPHPSYANVTSDPSAGMRYALPVQQDPRLMSGGRHKKEIKRRTKTGCLTCRKRRIKCDEGLPQCRNCQKSKRDCQGYDPVFKSAPGPTAIQPAPSSAPHAGGLSSTSHPYGNQSHLLSNTPYGTGNMAYDPAAMDVAAAGHQVYDYASAIDPALEAALPAAGAPYHQATPGKRTVNDLLSMGGPPPPPTNIDMNTNPSSLDEVKHLYYSIYAPGLENFLESKWFSVKGLARLLDAKALLDQFGSLLTQFSKTTPNDMKGVLYTTSVEARVVWSLASMVRTIASELNGQREVKTVPSNDDPIEAANRLTVFETLLTGKVAISNPLTSPVPGSTDHHRLRELEFWYTLANFVMLQDGDAEAAKAIDDNLSALRNLLDGRENRDVLYSIAVVRAIGPRVSEYTPGDTPLHLDESDNKSKLLVAKKFVSDEASGNGTTNVIRRLCELANRSWSPTVAAVPVVASLGTSITSPTSTATAATTPPK